jgi:hypothetical protein
MILLDTNVISELMRPRPNPTVEDWIGLYAATDFYISAITEAELRYGVEAMPQGSRQRQLQAALAGMLEEDFVGRILPFDSAAAIAYATIATERRRAGRPISQMDAQIASIARSKGAPLATRNATDFNGCGITVVNPWNP